MIKYFKYGILFVIICLLFSTCLHAQIITIKQDGSGDFNLIQQGVDSASNGDTVLVWPGTYIENIVVVDKYIVLGSLMLTTDSLHYISQTIIDGNMSGSCILVKNTQDYSTVNGFTLTNGSGDDFGSGMGGGIFVYYAKVYLANCNIKGNSVKGNCGGLSIWESDAYLSAITIKENFAYEYAGGLGIVRSNVEFDSTNLCSIYLNYASIGADIVRGECDTPTHFYLDTFTVINPDRYYILSYYEGIFLNDYSVSIQNGKIETVSEDVYVSPLGDNKNSGTDPSTPFKDIWYALLKVETDSISPNTIHVANGTYKLSEGERYSLGMKRYVSIKGESRDSCILDAEDEIFQIRGFRTANHYNLINFTLKNGNGWKNTAQGYSNAIIHNNINSSLSNIIITENKSRQACIELYNSNGFILENVVINENIGGVGLWSGHGDALAVYSDTVRFYNCQFSSNIPDYSISPFEGAYGGGVFQNGDYYPGRYYAEFYNCLFNNNHARSHPTGGMNSSSLLVTNSASVTLVNCTFGDNSSDNTLGASIGITTGSKLDIYNSVLYHNEPAEIYTASSKGPDSLNIYNSLIQGGEEAIRVYSPGDVVYYDPSNIDTDPMWDTTSMYPYSLSAGSPCIDAGTLNLPSWIELPDTDLAGNPRVYNGYVDMGAYEYGPWVQTHEHEKTEKESFLSVWPNPFSYETNISYRIDKDGHCRINIYELNGQLVKVLYDMKGLKGSGQITWNGKDQSNNPLKSGNYFINIIINGKEKDVIKVVKL